MQMGMFVKLADHTGDPNDSVVCIVHVRGDDIYACHENGTVRKYCWADVLVLLDPHAFENARREMNSGG